MGNSQQTKRRPQLLEQRVDNVVALNVIDKIEDDSCRCEDDGGVCVL